MASRRKFSDEYKREAVRLATGPGVTKSQVASELGINANLLNALAFALADFIPWVARRAVIDRTATVLVVLRHVRSHPQLPECLHVLASVVVLVASKGRATSSVYALQHLFRSLTLSGPHRLGRLCRNHETMTVLRNDVPHKAQLRFLSAPLAIQPCLRIRCRGVRIVLAALGVKVTLASNPTPRSAVIFILRSKALLARLCLDQRAVHREVFIR